MEQSYVQIQDTIPHERTKAADFSEVSSGNGIPILSTKVATSTKAASAQTELSDRG
jgi:hypothetical protein